MDTLFGEGQTGPKILLFLVVVLGLLALAFWLLRRFGGGRLGSSATRGRQPRLAMIDQAAIDNRRRLILIRRDNVEHLLIIGGPTDVVIEQNIVRAPERHWLPGGRQRRPIRCRAQSRSARTPCGRCSRNPRRSPRRPRASNPRSAPNPLPRPQRPPTGVEEPIHWPGESRTAGDGCARSSARGRRRGSANPALSIRSRAWRKSSRASRRLPSPAVSNRARLRAAGRDLRSRHRRRATHCRRPARASARRPKSVRDGATAGGRAATFAQVRGRSGWRAAWRARAPSPAGAGRTGPGGFRATSRPRGWEPRCAARSGPTMSAPSPFAPKTAGEPAAARHGRIYARAVRRPGSTPCRAARSGPTMLARCPRRRRGGRTGR